MHIYFLQKQILAVTSMITQHVVFSHKLLLPTSSGSPYHQKSNYLVSNTSLFLQVFLIKCGHKYKEVIYWLLTFKMLLKL